MLCFPEGDSSPSQTASTSDADQSSTSVLATLAALAEATAPFNATSATSKGALINYGIWDEGKQGGGVPFGDKKKFCTSLEWVGEGEAKNVHMFY